MGRPFLLRLACGTDLRASGPTPRRFLRTAQRCEGRAGGDKSCQPDAAVAGAERSVCREHRDHCVPRGSAIRIWQERPCEHREPERDENRDDGDHRPQVWGSEEHHRYRQCPSNQERERAAECPGVRLARGRAIADAVLNVPLCRKRIVVADLARDLNREVWRDACPHLVSSQCAKLRFRVARDV